MNIKSPFPKGFGFSFLHEKASVENELLEGEKQILSTFASPKRRREFALGRKAARCALKQIGFVNKYAILRGEEREPLWPDGFIGSITHAKSYAVAACCPSELASGVGIDLQDTSKMRNIGIYKFICTEHEAKWLSNSEENNQQSYAKFFSAKESIYKAFYIASKYKLRFKDVNLSWIQADRAFSGELMLTINDKYKKGFNFTVGGEILNRFVFTYLTLKNT
jgi:4'-phosphopantetheinyl transferase EntD